MVKDDYTENINSMLLPRWSEMATLNERLDAVCMGLNVTIHDGIKQAIEEFVEKEEYNKKCMEGCGETHSCASCQKPFSCWNFCGQTFYPECKVCSYQNPMKNKKWGK